MQYLCVCFFKACLSSYLDCELHDIWGDLCSTLYTHIIAYSRHLSNNAQQIDKYICFWKKKGQNSQQTMCFTFRSAEGFVIVQRVKWQVISTLD